MKNNIPDPKIGRPVTVLVAGEHRYVAAIVWGKNNKEI